MNQYFLLIVIKFFLYRRENLLSKYCPLIHPLYMVNLRVASYTNKSRALYMRHGQRARIVLVWSKVCSSEGV